MFTKSLNNTNPLIISRKINGIKYYEIEYYDKSKEETCVGFGSYNRQLVEDWLAYYFY